MFPRGKQSFFLAITLVVILAVILLAGDVKTALLVIGLIANFFIISSQMVLISERHAAEGGASGADVAGRPAAADSSLVSNVPWFGWNGGHSGFQDKEDFASRPVPVHPHEYPGGLGVHDMPPGDTNYQTGPFEGPPGDGAVYSPAPADALAQGPYPDNPFDLNRVDTAAQETCDYGMTGESRDTHDADRKVVDHARWRHDPYRVTAGIMRRKHLLEEYVAEELDEAENLQWWGRSEW